MYGMLYSLILMIYLQLLQILQRISSQVLKRSKMLCFLQISFQRSLCKLQNCINQLQDWCSELHVGYAGEFEKTYISLNHFCQTTHSHKHHQQVPSSVLSNGHPSS
ncbi:hypothetical protein FGO68_gene1282 [Halteria grandinella]|uniref:Uncharacterized protein n=1 Tax=Halteria grandinella TaxID=5974 RepID=A0A8J8SY24_HALGN|nr:hypothetical protein FGO68_gene1282 [Halteria grandinella]